MVLPRVFAAIMRLPGPLFGGRGTPPAEKTKFFSTPPLMLNRMAPSYLQPQLLAAGNTVMLGG
ncbi:hypothetical protein BIY27_04970 [Gibbsiella quercinecans]|uniref:Uncharacterized protein n=1 Tax=Gibbsiella quercinecans TaxID=929813 RepID=A0A250B024_9GAMM|nr:hypothetical protein AWC35_08810 [Gibbsiella quercinecans]RLM11374.1 hypothetical protein BIY31_05190 [Gibbsiella quercinecans]RLM13914.1 hypothetical protein BIY30_03860 [Gibbsiella quercinecans]RLM15696.1 hypothetical protein BIY27_04970 [Gibbsiella quercinecans]